MSFPNYAVKISFSDFGVPPIHVGPTNPLPVTVVSGGAGGNASVSLNASAFPGSSTQIGFQSGANLVAVSAAAPLPVTYTGTTAISAASLPLPAGAATQATLASVLSALGSPLQAGGNVAVTNFPVTYAVTGTFWQATQPVSAASLPLPAGASTAALQPAINGDGGSLAHVTNFPATQPVSIASMPSTPVTGTFFQATQPVSATALPLPAGASTAALQSAINADGGSQTHVMNFPATQAVSAASLPLPTGAATSTLQTTINTTLGTPMQQTGGSVSVTGTTAISAAALPLPAGASTAALQAAINADGGSQTHVMNFPATQPVSAAALPLPAGASTSALQTTLNTSVSAIQAATPALGAAATAASSPVTQASDTASGTLGSLNATVVCPTTGAGTAIFQLSGAWSGSVTFEGSNDNFATSQAITSVYLGGLAPQSAVVSANGFYSVLSAGFLKVQARMSAYTSGTATVLATTSVASRVVVPVQGNPVNLQMTATQGGTWAMANAALESGNLANIAAVLGYMQRFVDLQMQTLAVLQAMRLQDATTYGSSVEPFDVMTDTLN